MSIEQLPQALSERTRAALESPHGDNLCSFPIPRRLALADIKWPDSQATQVTGRLPGRRFGAVAQLGECRVRNAEVEGSIPFGST